MTASRSRTANGASAVTLRLVAPSDQRLFFEHQRDPAAIRMAAFAAAKPNDRAAFNAHWKRIAADPKVLLRTVVFEGDVAGRIVSFERDGRPEVGYWIAREYWGRGIATGALRAFLRVVTERPLYACAATDNVASIRVLEKCGFAAYATNNAFANARDEEIAETIFILT